MDYKNPDFSCRVYKLKLNWITEIQTFNVTKTLAPDVIQIIHNSACNTDYTIDYIVITI